MEDTAMRDAGGPENLPNTPLQLEYLPSGTVDGANGATGGLARLGIDGDDEDPVVREIDVHLVPQLDDDTNVNFQLRP